MKRKLTVIVLVLALALWGATALAGGPKAFRGTVDDPQVTDFQAISISSQNSGDAGMILEVEAQIEGIGKAIVNINASWDFDTYFDGSRHPCALVDKISQGPFLNLLGAPTTYMAEVTIEAKNGDVLVGFIAGGSVCELEVFVDGTINQWLIAFEVDPDDSTGKFAGKTGQGTIDFKVDSRSPGSFVQPFQISLNLD